MSGKFRPLLQQAPLTGLQPAVARGSWLGPSVSIHKGQLSEEAREQEEVAGQSFSHPQRFLEIATKQSCAEEQRFGTSEIHFPVQVRHNVVCNRCLLCLQLSQSGPPCAGETRAPNRTLAAPVSDALHGTP